MMTVPDKTKRCGATLGPADEQCCSYFGHPGKHLIRNEARCQSTERGRQDGRRCCWVNEHGGSHEFYDTGEPYIAPSKTRCKVSRGDHGPRCNLDHGHGGSHVYLAETIQQTQVAVNSTTADTARGDFVKADAQKRPLDLLPFVAVEEVAEVLAYGARKYAPNNWRKVDKRSRYFAAALRHLFAYAKGEDRDPESGLRHLAHAACSVLFLLEADVSNLGEDDRHSKQEQT